jgi:hypothetical protein
MWRMGIQQRHTSQLSLPHESQQSHSSCVSVDRIVVAFPVWLEVFYGRPDLRFSFSSANRNTSTRKPHRLDSRALLWMPAERGINIYVTNEATHPCLVCSPFARAISFLPFSILFYEQLKKLSRIDRSEINNPSTNNTKQ